MALVVSVFGHLDVENIGLLNGHPDRRGPFLPLSERKILRCVIDRIWVVARFDKCQKIIWHSTTRLAAILLQLLVKQTDVFGSRHFHHRTFPDGAAAVQYPAGVLVRPDDLSGE